MPTTVPDFVPPEKISAGQAAEAALSSVTPIFGIGTSFLLSAESFIGWPVSNPAFGPTWYAPVEIIIFS